MKIIFEWPLYQLPFANHVQVAHSDDALKNFIETKVSLPYMHVLRRTSPACFDWPSSSPSDPSHLADMRAATMRVFIRFRQSQCDMDEFMIRIRAGNVEIDYFAFNMQAKYPRMSDLMRMAMELSMQTWTNLR